MSIPAGMHVLRPGALAGRTVAVAGGAAAIADRFRELGADVRVLDADLLDEDAVGRAVAAAGHIDVLIADADGPFRAAGGDAAGLRRGVDGAWNAIRATARACWMDPAADRGTETVGAALLIAPPAGAGELATATAAALENTARTLSTEWARFGIVTVAALPGPSTTREELTELVAFLASPAGAYYSGCAFTLR